MVENLSHFWSWWKELQQFGVNADGSLTRLAFTEPDVLSRRWLATVWEQMGARVTIDGVGNIIAQKGSPPFIVVSSHTDSVPQGGHYDGILGVLAGTLLLEGWSSAECGLLVIDWSCEESSRFGVSTVGSRIACQETIPWDKQDLQGVSLQQAATASFGGAMKRYWTLPIDQVCAALELHMEQGSVLRDQRLPCAVVSAIAAPQRCLLTIEGEANHSGSTAMADRHDAIAAAAVIVQSIEQLSHQFEAQGLRATITRWDASSGAANVIAYRTSLLLDIRAQSPAALTTFFDGLTAVTQTLQKHRGVSVTLHTYSQEQPAALSASLSQILQEMMNQAGMKAPSIPSWPSHDSLVLARHVPTAMMFVRNVSAVSHQAREYCAPEDIALGLRLFKNSIDAICQDFGQRF